MNIKQAIQYGTQQLTEFSSTPRLDAELLIALSCKKDRTYLYQEPEYFVTNSQQQLLNHYLKRRISGEPIAYILGYQEFWSLTLKVTPDTLIPRPETEQGIEWLLTHLPKEESLKIADLGTGSGAIALALKSERPHWQIDATDQSKVALEIAKQNAADLNQSINFYLGDWCQALPNEKYHAIVSNPPYIAANDTHLHVLKFEPKSALVPGITGLESFQLIAATTPHYLQPQGHLILEHGCEQTDAVKNILADAGFANIICHRDLAGLPRFITAQRK